MTTAAIRKKLISYLETADEKEVKAIYTLVEDKINEPVYALTIEQMDVVNERRVEYLSGKDSGSTWQTTHKNIRDRRRKQK